MTTNPWERLREAVNRFGDFADHTKKCHVTRYQSAGVVGQQMPRCSCGFGSAAEDLTEVMAELPANPEQEQPALDPVSLNKLPPRAVKYAFYDEPRGDARLDGTDGDATLRDWLDHKHNPLGDPLEGVVAELVRRALHTKVNQ